MYGYPMSMLPKEFADLDRAERTEKARRLSRYDEAIRLLRAEVGTPALCWTDRKAIIEAFRAAETADKGAT